MTEFRDKPLLNVVLTVPLELISCEERSFHRILLSFLLRNTALNTFLGSGEIINLVGCLGLKRSACIAQHMFGPFCAI